jgi:predicted metal-dependent HD superfamily phosphohydrolase
MINPNVDIFGEFHIVSFLKHLGITGAEDAYLTIRKLYSGDDRFYHTLSHIVDGLNQLPKFADYLDDKDAFTLAWLFHDAVYDSHKKDNEEKSAEMLENLCISWGVDRDLILRAKQLVMATKHGVNNAGTSDEKWLVDLDMSILGKPGAEYDLYENNVRREYGWVSTKDWAVGRSEFLLGLRPPYFQTHYFADQLGEHAEQNIRRSIAMLTNAAILPDG